MGFFAKARSTLSSLKHWFNQLAYRWKITIWIATTGAIAFLSIFFPHAEPLKHAPAWVRLAVLVFLFINLIWSLIALVERGERTDTLASEKEELKNELEGVKNELKQLELEKQSLLEVDEIIWERPDAGGNQFVPLSERRTVIVSMLNLKGGVGKTTITANVAACLARHAKPLRTLIVDLDFQGTLSDACVEQGTLTLLRQTRSTVSSLLADDVSPDTLRGVAVPMTKVSGAYVVCAYDRLDTLDFRLQAQFFLDAAREVRFLFQKIFHNPSIADHYDLVLFDCPPRLTTSTVNALTCSDFVLIPTKLDRSSVTAVPRTLTWLAKMGRIVQAKPVGVIANEVQNRSGRLINDHKNVYDFLSKNLIPPTYGNIVFEATVPFSNRVAQPRDLGVVAAADANVSGMFAGVAEELRRRLGI